jgi:hypothetical protein
MMSAEDPDYEPSGLAFPAWPEPRINAILQPPPPDIPASPLSLERMADRDPDWEAGG